MAKITAKDILKRGVIWDPKHIDRNDPEVIALIEQTKKAQAECLQRKEIDYHRLHQIIGT